MTSADCTSSFLLNRSASLPQIGVVAVIASSVATTTQVYPVWLPLRSVTMRGSALVTTVLDSIATNIASSSPESASSTSRCDIWPQASTGDSFGAVEMVVGDWVTVFLEGLLSWWATVEGCR